MQLCEHFAFRRSFDRPGKLLIVITLICSLTVFVNTLKNRYAESSRQERYRTYLHEMGALHPRIINIEEHLYRDLDDMEKLHSLMGDNPHSQLVSLSEDDQGKDMQDMAKAADSTVDRQNSLG